jgi:hypothetical protein
MASSHRAVPRSNAKADRVYSVAAAVLFALTAAATPVEGQQEKGPNLLESLAPGGPMHDQKAFIGVLATGRTEKGMPAFGKTLEPDQIDAIYSYLVGRAATRIPQGRPARPGGN